MDLPPGLFWRGGVDDGAKTPGGANGGEAALSLLLDEEVGVVAVSREASFAGGLPGGGPEGGGGRLEAASAPLLNAPDSSGVFSDFPTADGLWNELCMVFS